MLSVRILTTDFYMSDPIQGLDPVFSQFRQQSIKKVPVIRIFGITKEGFKACLHIHGVFPYFYVPQHSNEESYIRQLFISIDEALNVALNRSKSFQHVHSIEECELTSMYGFNTKQKFLKICFYHPGVIRKCADLLINKAVMNEVFQPYESHIPFHLQFFIDYNLFGMNFIEIGSATLRSHLDLPLPAQDGKLVVTNIDLDNYSFIPAEIKKESGPFAERFQNSLNPETTALLSRASTCMYEFDAHCCSILNVTSEEHSILNPGLLSFCKSNHENLLHRASAENLRSNTSRFTEEELRLIQLYRNKIFKRKKLLPAHSSNSLLNASQASFFASSDNTPIINLDSINFVVSQYPSFSDQVLATEKPADENPDDVERLAKLLALECLDDSCVLSDKPNGSLKRSYIQSRNKNALLKRASRIVKNAKKIQQKLLKKSSKKQLEDHCLDQGQNNLKFDYNELYESSLAKSSFISPSYSPGFSADHLTCDGFESVHGSFGFPTLGSSPSPSDDGLLNEGFISDSMTPAHSSRDSIGGEFFTANSCFLPCPASSTEKLCNRSLTECHIDASTTVSCRWLKLERTIRFEKKLNHHCSVTSHCTDKADENGTVRFFIGTKEWKREPCLCATSRRAWFKTLATLRVSGRSAKHYHRASNTSCLYDDVSLIQSLSANTGSRSNRKVKNDAVAVHSKYNEKKSLSLKRQSRMLLKNNELKVLLGIFKHRQKNPLKIKSHPDRTSASLEPKTLKFTQKKEQENYALSTDSSKLKNLHSCQHLTLMSIEIHVRTRANIVADADIDQLLAVFISIYQESSDSEISTFLFVLNGDNFSLSRMWNTRLSIFSFDSEKDIFDNLIYFIRKIDPDIVVSFDVSTLVYLIKRARLYDINFQINMSRLFDERPKLLSKLLDSRNVNIPGRVVLELWRILRNEIALTSYTFENFVFHVLKERIPKLPSITLTSWFQSASEIYRNQFIDYYLIRSLGNLKLIKKLDFIDKISEFARIYGIEFYHVISRGSQYRVESMMLRIAKSLSFVPVSPCIHQRKDMRAPEAIPLTLEPQSGFFTDPVAVFDYQSLYPSIIIAYNLCFSTCLGRVELFDSVEPFKFGCCFLNLPFEIVSKLDPENDVTFAPSGVAFVKSHIRRGILPVMLEEIIRTRLVVKKSMAINKSDVTLCRLLNSRQLGLKLIANVTYGYTSAHFSGRMPCVEVGDSVVHYGRVAMQKAINSFKTFKFATRVLYGDTDSIFVEFTGMDRSCCFDVVNDAAKRITSMFPSPIKLKFEKIYQPCVLMAKKRYAGLMFETKYDIGKFDAKGIETVRRDGCPLLQRILHDVLMLLFRYQDISRVKNFLQREFRMILNGSLNPIEFVFAKEYRGRQYYRKSDVAVPALRIADKKVRADNNSEPYVGYRVPYVVVQGEIANIIDNVIEPYEFISEENYVLNTKFYVSKQIIPAVNRVLNFFGIDATDWLNEVNFSCRSVYRSFRSCNLNKTLSQYLPFRDFCLHHQSMNSHFSCACSSRLLLFRTKLDMSSTQTRLQCLSAICNACMRWRRSDFNCCNIDCPFLYQRKLQEREVLRMMNMQ